MILTVTLCASILSSRPGCFVDSIPLVVDVIPSGCFEKAQEVIAEKRVLFEGLVVARYGCERPRSLAQ